MQFEVGTILDGKVTGITKFGAFVELEGGKTGMVHISEVAATYVKEISDYVAVGQTVKVKVLSVGDDGKISLSMKKAVEAPPKTESQQQFRPRHNNNNGGQRGGYGYDRSSRAASAEPTSFDDMLSKFMQSSDEKMSDLKKFAQPTRGASRRK